MTKVSSRVLISWIGGNDIKAVSGGERGPILSTLQSASFGSVVLLYAYPMEQVRPYLAWLAEQVDVPVTAHYELLPSPVDYRGIYLVARMRLSALKEIHAQVSILLSPGTPAMQAVWVLLGKTYFPATFYQSSLERGVEQVDLYINHGEQTNAAYLQIFRNIFERADQLGHYQMMMGIAA